MERTYYLNHIEITATLYKSVKKILEDNEIKFILNTVDNTRVIVTEVGLNVPTETA